MPSNAGSINSPGTHTYQEFSSDGDGPVVVSSVSNAIHRSWTRSSVTTPGYKQFRRRVSKARGIDLPMNPYSYSLKDSPGKQGRIFQVTKNNDTGRYYGTVDDGYWGSNISDPYRNPDIVSALKYKTLNKILGKLHDQSVNLGNAIGEGRQVISLFASTASSIAGAARQLRRGDLSGATQILTGRGSSVNKKDVSRFERDMRISPSKAIANRWLELQYGWSPLLSDLFGSCEFLANKLYRVPRYKETSSSSRIVNESDEGWLSPDIYVRNYNRGSYTVKYVIYYSQQGSHDLAALGLINPLSIAWELTPWSFVVDWFLPIGTFLNNLDATYGLEFVKGCVTEFWEGETGYNYSGTSYTVGNTTKTVMADVRQRCRMVVVSRQKLTSFPSSPLPRFKDPKFGASWTSENKGLTPHTSNALALLTQAFGKGKGPVPTRGIGKYDVGGNPRVDFDVTVGRL